MRIDAFQAAQAYGLAKSATKVEPPASEQKQGAVFDAVHALSGAVAKGEQASVQFLTGGADPHSVVEALAAAELAIETATTIRDKVVEAYQELLRMPV